MSITLLLDIIILVFLAGTIFYAARLMHYFKSFKQEKESIIGLMSNLSVTIEKAQESIGTMKQSASQTADDMHSIMSTAKSTIDELAFMNSSGDKLADRLEKLADRNKELMTLMEKSGGIGHLELEQPAKKRPKSVPKDEFEIQDIDVSFDMELDEDDENDFQALENGAYEANRSPKPHNQKFNIFDREFIQPIQDSDKPAAQTNTQAKPQNAQKFSSKAEQDLYEALQRKKNNKLMSA